MKYFVVIPLLFLTICTYSQKEIYSEKDSLRGGFNENRSWWDLQKYELDIGVDVEGKSISGKNKVLYKVLREANIMQIDLQEPMHISTITQDGEKLAFKNQGAVYWIELKKNQYVDSINSLDIIFSGVPKETTKAPWEGGFTWGKDSNGIDFIATACQGDGASLWWPCKDHLADEPDLGIDLAYTVPENLVAVGNGRLVKTDYDSIQQTKTYHWKVINPINNYAVQMSIGNYVSYANTYQGEAGDLYCDYYVLKQNFYKAKKQFQQVDKMLEAFEFWFGPYPFYEDGYKLVEVPYLGMEHQSAVSYGNNYENGYRGTDLSGSGWGLKFDFIIIHESGHEWFGNNITNKDIADMWIHESFTNYSEVMYLDHLYGLKAGNAYVQGIRKNIKNDKPIIGTYGVNQRGSDDMYYKGANMLHTIRYVIGNEGTWRLLLRGLNHKFYHQTVTTEDVENYISEFTKTDFSTVFDQYLRTTQIPTLEYKVGKKYVKARWTNCIPDLQLPVRVYINNIQYVIKPTSKWKKTKFNVKIEAFDIDQNYYINTKEMD